VLIAVVKRRRKGLADELSVSKYLDAEVRCFFVVVCPLFCWFIAEILRVDSFDQMIEALAATDRMDLIS
jgi:hypothetical protein